MIDVERVIVVCGSSAEAATFVEGIERAAFRHESDLGRSFALLGDDGDHAAERVGAIEAALRPTQDLNALDIAGQQLAEIERAVRIARIADVDAVDEKLGVI